MRRIAFLGLFILGGCMLTGRSAIDRLAARQCAEVARELRVRTANMENLAQLATSKMELYEAIQTIRADLAVARPKCAADPTAQAEFDVIEDRIDRLEQDFILGPR